MANGAFNFKNNSGNIVSFISGSGSDIIISGGTLNLSNMTGLTLGNLTMEGTVETASFAPSYLLTSSFNTYSGTTNTVIGTLATTGSNLFKGTQTFSGSLIPAVDNTYDLGTATQQFRDLYLSSASLYIDGVKVLGSTTQELQITTDTGQSFKILEAGSDTITLQSNDGNITLATSGGGDVIMDPTNGIIALKGTTTIYAGNRILSSDGNNIHFGNGVVISGSLLATGTNLISGSSQILNGSGIVSSSSQVTGYGFSTTGSNTFLGSQVVTGSLFISENLIVAGSSSIQHISSSVVNIADNIITVNALNPSVRFGGLAVIDSGSNPQVSGSMLFDSVNNQWLFVHQNQGTVTSSVLLMGPETYNDLGNESYITANRLVKSTGIEHLTNSNISDNGTTVTILSNAVVNGTFSATGTTLVSGSVQVDVMSTTNIARLATTGSNTFSGNISISKTDTTSLQLNSTTATSYSTFYHSESGTAKAYWEYINSNFSNASRRNYLEAYNSVGGFAVYTADSKALDISTTGAATFSSSVTSNGAKPQLYVNGDSGNGAGIFLNTSLSGANRRNWAIFTEENIDGDFVIKCSTAAGGSPGSGNTRLAILNNGNVGINSTSPQSRFEVVDGTGSVFRAINSGTNIMEIGNYKSNGSGYQQLDIVASIVNFATGTAGGGSATNRMRIISDGRVGIGTTTPSGILHVTTSGTTASAPSLGWPVYNGELDANSRSVFIDTAGNGGVGTAGQGATISLILGQYFDSRVIITTPGAGSSSPSDQGTGRGRDMMIKAGAADNTVGYSGGRLYLNGGIGFGAGGFNANGGHIIMQGLTGSGNVGINDTNPQTKLSINGANYIEMATFACTSAASTTIVTDNSGYVQFSNGTARHLSNSSVFTSVTDGIRILKAGIVQVTVSQDITTAGTTGYVLLYIQKNKSTVSENLITNTNGEWDGINGVATIAVAADDVINFYYSAANITSLDANTWSNYSFIWSSR